MHPFIAAGGPGIEFPCQRAQPRTHGTEAPSFDPFGEQAAVARPGALRRPRAQRVGIIVFLGDRAAAGRRPDPYTSDLPIARTVVAALTGTSAPVR